MSSTKFFQWTTTLLKFQVKLNQTKTKGLAHAGPFYRHLVYLLLRRRMRKLCFLISNFKHSTGVFELTLPDCNSLGDTNSPVDYSYLSLKTKKRSTSASQCLEIRKY
ncbi:hypothetical protein F6P62_07660 [Streptococcus suis]|nr:hypothetical protein [Streptococcus suis]